MKKAKTQTRQKRKSKPQANSQGVRAAPPARFDNKALTYAKLLDDPCTGDLTRPIYSGSDTGYVTRFRTQFTVLDSGAATCGFYHWIPGFNDGIGAFSLLGYTSSADTVVGAPTAMGGPSNVPGMSFFTSASEQRCVAACLRISYLGTELNRSGYIALGNIEAGSIAASGTYTTAQIAALLPYHDRVPDHTIEIKWLPGHQDQEFMTYGKQSAASPDGRKALTFAIGGLVATAGVLVELVSVVEWVPAAASGISAPTAALNSSYQLNDVVNFLRSRNWQQVVQVGSVFAQGAMRLAGGFSNRRALTW